jgi:hypothetical protein
LGRFFGMANDFAQAAKVEHFDFNRHTSSILARNADLQFARGNE